MHKSSYTPLKEAYKQAGKEIDLVVKILKVFDKDDNDFELRVKDLSQESWPLIVHKLKFCDFQPGEIYRVRGVSVEKINERNVIKSKMQTNFLKFSKDSLIYRELAAQVQDDQEEDDPNELLDYPKYATMITTQTTDEIKFYKLQDLFTNFDALTESEKQKNYFRVRL